MRSAGFRDNNLPEMMSICSKSQVQCVLTWHHEREYDRSDEDNSVGPDI